MFKAISLRAFRQLQRKFSTTNARNNKVCVVGAAGGIGQPLSLLLKCNDLVNELSMYDLENIKGVAADMSHIETHCEVHGFQGREELPTALHCANVVIIAAGCARTPEMSRDELFESNAEVVAEIVAVAGKICPTACIAIVTNPVNSNVPLAAEVLKQLKVFDPNRLFGVTTLDVVRSRSFLSDFLQINADRIHIEVIGGHSDNTILPVMSQCKPKVDHDDDNVKRLVKRVQSAGTEIMKAKEGKGSATLSMAYAANKFTTAILRGLANNGAATECTFVASKVTHASFFATPIVFGKGGVYQNMGIPELAKEEKEALENMLPELIENIEKGSAYGIKCDVSKYLKVLEQKDKKANSGGCN